MPGDEIGHEAGIVHVAALDPERPAHGLVQSVEPAIAAEGVVERERGYLGALGDQRLDQMRADETVRAGDQNPLAAIAQTAFPYRPRRPRRRTAMLAAGRTIASGAAAVDSIVPSPGAARPPRSAVVQSISSFRSRPAGAACRRDLPDRASAR